MVGQGLVQGHEVCTGLDQNSGFNTEGHVNVRNPVIVPVTNIDTGFIQLLGGTYLNSKVRPTEGHLLDTVV